MLPQPPHHLHCRRTFSFLPVILRKHLRILLEHFGWCHDSTVQELCDGAANCVDRGLRNPRGAECMFEAFIGGEEHAGGGYRDENYRANALVKTAVESATGDGCLSLVNLMI